MIGTLWRDWLHQDEHNGRQGGPWGWAFGLVMVALAAPRAFASRICLFSVSGRKLTGSASARRHEDRAKKGRIGLHML